MKTVSEQTQAFRIALALVGICVDDLHAELILKLYEGFKKKGMTFNVKDAIDIERKVKHDFADKEVFNKKVTATEYKPYKTKKSKITSHGK